MTGNLNQRTKLAYGATDLGFSISSTIIGFFFLIYLTDIVGLKPALAGTTLFFCKAWDAVIDPFIGHFSDHLHSRLGRRRPFFLYGAVPYGLSFMLLWNLPSLSGTLGSAAIVGIAFIIHITAMSLLSVPYVALAPELARDYDDRTSLTAYRMAFSIIGGLLAAVLPMILVHAFSAPRVGYGVMGAVFGAFLIGCPLIAFFGTGEPARPPAVSNSMPFWREFLSCFKNRPFIAAMLMFLATWVAVDVLTATFEYYLKYRLGMSGQSSIVLGLLFISAALCLPLWVRTSEAFGKKPAYFAGMIGLSLVLFGLMWVRPGQPLLAYALAVLAGVGISAAHVLPYAILPDVIEHDEWLTGQRREGVYFGVIMFLRQLAASGAMFLVGQALDRSGYVANAVQTPSALLCIRVMIGIIPGVLLILGMSALAFYPIDKSRFTAIRAQIEARRTGGTAPASGK